MGASLDLKAHAIAALDEICNKRDFEKATTYLDPDMIQYHDDSTIKGAETFINTFKQILQHVPDFHLKVIDAVVEGNKVWVFSKISGLPNGDVKDSVDMLHFNDEGKLVMAKDVQRSVVVA